MYINTTNAIPCIVTANVVPSSTFLVTLMMEALSSSETSILSRATGRNIQEDGILHSHRRENLKFYNCVPEYIYEYIYIYMCVCVCVCVYKYFFVSD
jgi:hypothetical protein